MTPPRTFTCSRFGRTWICGALAAPLAVFPAGCGLVPPPRSDHGAHQVFGRWTDTDAAVEVAARQSQMAVDHHVENDSDLERTYFLWTATDEPATLKLSRAPGEASEVSRIDIAACVGRFGDAQRQYYLELAVSRRLTDLARRGYAPVRSMP